MSYLTEAFKALDALNEDTFSVSDDGIKKLAEFETDDDLLDEITVFDADAEDTEDLEDSYVGKVIVDCNVCHSKIYKDKSDVVIDEETQNANIDEECPYCYSTDGFKVIGEVAPMTTETEEKVVINNDIDESLNEATVTDYKGSLSNVLVKNKDKISKMATKGEIVDFLNSITDEVRDQKYLETVKRNMQKKNDFGALQYIYGIILSGEGKGVTETLEENIGQDIDEYQQWIDYDMKRYHKISDKTNDEIKKAGLQVVKDKYGDYQVIAGKYDESLKESTSMSRNQLIDYLETNWNTADNYQQLDDAMTKIYGSDDFSDDYPGEGMYANFTTLQLKQILNMLEGTDESLKESYNEDLLYAAQMSFESGHRFNRNDFESNKDFKEYSNLMELGPQGFYEEYKDTLDFDPDFVAEYGIEESLKESVKDIAITTDHSKTTMTSDEEGKVTLTTEPVDEHRDEGEVIEPLTDETEAEIIDNDGKEDIDIEDFDEESFDELGEGYFKKVYENVSSFKTSNVSNTDNKIVVEGVITFDNNTKKNTKFIFESVSKKNDKYRMIGENVNITKGNKAFSLMGSIKDKKFLSESLNYNYRTKNDIGKSTRCLGTVRRG